MDLLSLPTGFLPLAFAGNAGVLFDSSHQLSFSTNLQILCSPGNVELSHDLALPISVCFIFLHDSVLPAVFLILLDSYSQGFV